MKKLGFHISVKDGIGVDLETHQPKESVIKNPAVSQQSISSPIKSNMQALPIPQSEKLAEKSIENSPADNQSLDVKNKIEKIIIRFKGQILQGHLFGRSREDCTVQCYSGKISTLPPYLVSKFDIHAIAGIHITEASSIKGYWDTYKYGELFVICVPEIPANRKKWVSDLQARANLTSDDALIWVVVSNDFPKDLRATLEYTFDKPKILTSPLIDVEAIERRLLQH